MRKGDIYLCDNRIFLSYRSLICLVAFTVFIILNHASENDSTHTKTASSRRLTAVTFRWENDAVAGTDENYSNGISFSVSREGKSWVGKVWDLIGLPDEDTDYYTSYELGQIIITPADTRIVPPDPNDRPYAGILYFGLSSQWRSIKECHGLKLVLGVVGPLSFAEETQSWFHRLLGNDVPMGWDYQIKNEPVINLVYEYRRSFRLFSEESDMNVELIPILGVMAGNMLTQGSLGTQLRIGYNLPIDFGTTQMRGLGNLPLPSASSFRNSKPKWGIYLFSTIGGVGVLRNLTLDGNTICESPHVTKEPFFPTGEVGISVWFKRLQLTSSLVYWGEEFESQKRASKFGTLSITVYF